MTDANWRFTRAFVCYHHIFHLARLRDHSTVRDRGVLLVRSLICWHRSLIRLFRFACSTCLLRTARFTRSRAHSLLNSWERGFCPFSLIRARRFHIVSAHCALADAERRNRTSPGKRSAGNGTTPRTRRLSNGATLSIPGVLTRPW